MKVSFLILCCLMSFEMTGQTLDDLDWILGTWDRQNAKAGRTHHERWWKVSDDYIQGIGVAMEGTDTVFVEHLGIALVEGYTYYVADVSENPEPVYFQFTSQSEYAFVSENPRHDAPKKIAYDFDGEIMTARVSWDDGGFKAIFKRRE